MFDNKAKLTQAQHIKAASFTNEETLLIQSYIEDSITTEKSEVSSYGYNDVLHNEKFERLEVPIFTSLNGK